MERSDYVRGWKERIRQEEAERVARSEDLHRRALDAARALGRLGARKVLLFGSVALRRTHGRSDIDLATEGLPALDLLRAFGAVEEAVGPGIAVDVIRIEEASPRLKRTIETHGEVLLAQ